MECTLSNKNKGREITRNGIGDNKICQNTNENLREKKFREKKTEICPCSLPFLFFIKPDLHVGIKKPSSLCLFLFCWSLCPAKMNVEWYTWKSTSKLVKTSENWYPLEKNLLIDWLSLAMQSRLNKNASVRYSTPFLHFIRRWLHKQKYESPPCKMRCHPC